MLFYFEMSINVEFAETRYTSFFFSIFRLTFIDRLTTFCLFLESPDRVRIADDDAKLWRPDHRRFRTQLAFLYGFLRSVKSPCDVT